MLCQREHVATIDAARVLTPEGFVGPTRVHLDGGHISHLEPLTSTTSERTVAPGFVDLQVNGVGAVDFATAADSDAIGSPLRWSKPGWASVRSSPSTITRFSIGNLPG